MTISAAERLANAGMSEFEALRKARLFERVAQQLPAADRSDMMRWFVPGRIEVLGKHTDYAGGRSLLCTAERGFCIAALPREDAVVQIADLVRGQNLQFNMSAELAIPASGWSVFPMVVARRMTRNFGGNMRGALIVFASDLPSAAGMSSSSALLTAMFTVLGAVNQLPERPEFRADINSGEDLAAYLGCMENGQTYKSLVGDSGVGTFGGSEDHTAILASQPGRLKQYSFCPVRLERTVDLPTDLVFVIAVSGVVADKTGAARTQYNRASQATKAILDTWRAETGSTVQTLAQIVAGESNCIQQVRRVLERSGANTTWLSNRFEQFWRESEVIIPRATEALSSRDLKRFGELVEESQVAAEALLGNQVAETIWLASRARALGACAASAFGAGFGGSVWALIPRDDAARFADRWRDHYVSSFPERAGRSNFFITAAGPSLTGL